MTTRPKTPALLLVEEAEQQYHVPDGTIFLTRDGPISDKIIGKYDSQLHAEAEAAATALARSKLVSNVHPPSSPKASTASKRNGQSEHDSGKEQTDGSVSEAALSPGSLQDDADREPILGWLRKLQKEPSVDIGRLASRGLFGASSSSRDPDQEVSLSFVSGASSSHSSSPFETDSFERRSVQSSIRRFHPDVKTKTTRGWRAQDEVERQTHFRQRLDLGEAGRHVIEVAYVVGKGLTSCDDFIGMSNLQSIWLAGNKIFSLQPLAAMEHLKVIDASDNSIQFFPIKPGQRTMFTKLQILFLHNNMIQRSSSLEGISHTHQLRAITLHGNPFAEIPTYRSSTFDLCPALQVLDGTFIGELDVARTPLTRNMLLVEHARRLRRYVQHKALALPSALTDISRNTPFAQHMVNLEEAARALHKGFENSRPTVVLQRVFRGHRGRTMFRKLNIAFTMPVLAMQRWMLKSWVTKYLVVPCTDLRASGDSALRACLAKLPLQRNELSYSQRLQSCSLYFLPEDGLMISSLLSQCSGFFDKDTPPSLLISDVCLLRCDPASQGSIEASPFMHNLLVRQHHRARSLATACALTKVKLDPAAIPYAGIARRGFKASAAERAAFTQGFSWEWRPVPQGGGAPRKGERAHLLVVTFRTPGARSLMVRIIANLNRHYFSLPHLDRQDTALHAKRHQPLRIRHILSEVLQRKLAATSITSTIRGWLHRLRLRPSVGTALIMGRAARCIQKWWRWGVMFRIRMVCLTLLKERAAEIDDRVLYCLSPNIRERVLLADKVEPLIRESKFEMGYDSNGSICATPDMAFLWPSAADGTHLEHRPLIPKWVGFTIPLQEKGGETDEPLGMVLSHGCEVEHFRIGGTHSVLRGEAYESDILPRRKLMGKRAVIRLRFASVDEARARMALMLLRTFRVAQRDPVLLLTARRWFRSIFHFVVNGLGTTFAVERARSLTGGSRPTMPRYLSVSPGYLDAQSKRTMVLALGEATETIPPFEAEPVNETKEIDGGARTGMGWKGRRQPDLALTGQLPATGGRWAGMPNVCPWEAKKEIGMTMREENLEDKYELDVRNITDHHLKKWTARGEYHRRKVVAQLLEKGKTVTLKALGMRTEGTAAKAKTLHAENSREQIHYEKARRELVSSQNQRIRWDQLEKQKATRLVDKLTLQVAMQMRSMPASRSRPQTSFESVASTFSSADFDEVRPQTSHVDVRLHQEFSEHFRSSASLLGYHELRVRSAKRPPRAIAPPSATSNTNARMSNSRMSTADSGMRPSSRERLQMRKRADVKRQKEQYDAMTEDMLSREASRESLHRQRLHAQAQERPHSSHLLSFFDYPWVKILPEDSAENLIPDTARSHRRNVHTPNQKPASPPGPLNPSSATARTAEARKRQRPRPTSTNNLSMQRKVTAGMEVQRPMSTPVGESAGTPFTSDPFPRPQWQIFGPTGGPGGAGGFSEGEWDEDMDYYSGLDADGYSGLGSNPSTRPWTPEDVRGYGSTPSSRPWTAPEDQQPAVRFTPTNVGGALRLRPSQSPTQNPALRHADSMRGNAALPARTHLAASELAGALLRQQTRNRTTENPSSSDALAASEAGARGHRERVLAPQGQRLRPRPKSESARAVPAPARLPRPPRLPSPLSPSAHPKAGGGALRGGGGAEGLHAQRGQDEDAERQGQQQSPHDADDHAGSPDGDDGGVREPEVGAAPPPLGAMGAKGGLLRGMYGRKPRRASATDALAGGKASPGPTVAPWVSCDSPMSSPFRARDADARAQAQAQGNVSSGHGSVGSDRSLQVGHATGSVALPPRAVLPPPSRRATLGGEAHVGTIGGSPESDMDPLSPRDGAA